MRFPHFGVAIISGVKVEAGHGIRQEQLPDDLRDQEPRPMASAVLCGWLGDAPCVLLPQPELVAFVFSQKITRHFINQMY